METFYLIAVVLSSSLVLWLVARRGLRLEAAALARAAASAGELLGAAVLFWLLNAALAAGFALALRGLGLGFVSLYLCGDVTLPAAALLQALLFESWRRHSSASS